MRRLLLLLLVLLPLHFSQAGAAQTPEKVGEVLEVRQAVIAGLAAKDELSYSTLEEKKDVLVGMRVITKPRAGTSILFDPAGGPVGRVQIGSDTKLTFDEQSIEKIGDTIKGVWNLRVDVGRLLAMFSKKGTADAHKIKIATPNGLVILHGTAVYLDVARDGSTSLFVLEGSVTVESKAGGQVTVPAGSQTFIAAGQGPTTPVPFNVDPGGGPDLRTFGDAVLLEPLLIVLDDPRLNLPK